MVEYVCVQYSMCVHMHMHVFVYDKQFGKWMCVCNVYCSLYREIQLLLNRPQPLCMLFHAIMCRVCYLSELEREQIVDAKQTTPSQMWCT